MSQFGIVKRLLHSECIIISVESYVLLYDLLACCVKDPVSCALVDAHSLSEVFRTASVNCFIILQKNHYHLYEYYAAISNRRPCMEWREQQLEPQEHSAKSTESLENESFNRDEGPKEDPSNATCRNR